jgi:Uma2 family endonuclease
LRAGDHLTVEEFLRRYDAMPELKKAELIEGVVYMSSAVSIDHGGPHGMFMAWLGYYWMTTPGTEILDNTTVVLDLGGNCPQPDGCLRIVPECGGQSTTGKDRYVQGAPEFAGEIAVTSASYDLHEKLAAYQRNGVKEYVVWCVEERSIDWFVLRDDVFHKMRHRRGVFKSKVFPGLWLEGSAMLQRDPTKVLKVLQEGLDSEEHRRFVSRLARQKALAEREG